MEPAGTGSASGLGSLLMGLGKLMIVLPLLSFAINLIGFEFILLVPLEAFDNPTTAKFWTMGGGVGLVLVGGALGGSLDDDD